MVRAPVGPEEPDVAQDQRMRNGTSRRVTGRRAGIVPSARGAHRGQSATGDTNVKRWARSQFGYIENTYNRVNDVMLKRMTETLTRAQERRAAAKTFAVHNPATLEHLADVADATAEDARAAIETAARAMPAWTAAPALERARVLRRAEALMLERADALGRTLTLEGGKPLAEARGEIAYAASFFGWFAGEAERVYGRTIPASQASKRLMVIRQPVGVVGAITPWNFPAAMVTRKSAPRSRPGARLCSNRPSRRRSRLSRSPRFSRRLGCPRAF